SGFSRQSLIASRLVAAVELRASWTSKRPLIVGSIRKRNPQRHSLLPGLRSPRLHVLRILERQVRHEVGVMDDVGLGGAFHLVPFRCMGRDNVAHLVRNAALEGQRYSREGMPEGLAALALACLTIRSNFVLQKLAHVGKD